MNLKIDVKGSIIPDDYADVYAWLGLAYCAPCQVADALANASPGETVDVYINSPGGSVPDGSEIYEALRTYNGPVEIHIVGQACSAASIIAMAGHSEMAPTALLMVHRASTSVGGNKNDMEHAAAMLDAADNAICTAYMEKAGMSRADAIAMMDRETWLTAERAVEMKLVDKISVSTTANTQMVASGTPLLSLEAIHNARTQMKNQQARKAQAELELLKMKGE